jgi:ArsR family transcriptional regulator
MSSQSPKLALLTQFALVAKTLGHAHRLGLLEQLAQGERSVEMLAQKTGLSIANASQHLQHMRRAGLVTARRDGKFVYYRLADDAVLDLLAALGRLAERNVAEVEQIVRGYFHERDSLEAVSREDLRHLPGALNIPIRALEARLGELDPSKEIVAYCRGPYCVLSYEAVAALRARGFKVRRLQDGLPEWRAAGLPIVAGNA